MPKKLFFVLSLFVAAGCSKNNGSTTAYINFVAGSTQQNFEVTASNASLINNLYLLTIAATSTNRRTPNCSARGKRVWPNCVSPT